MEWISIIVKIVTDPIAIPAIPNKIAKIRKFFRFAIIIMNLFLIYLLDPTTALRIASDPIIASSTLTVSVP